MLRTVIARPFRGIALDASILQGLLPVPPSNACFVIIRDSVSLGLQAIKLRSCLSYVFHCITGLQRSREQVMRGNRDHSGSVECSWIKAVPSRKLLILLSHSRLEQAFIISNTVITCSRRAAGDNWDLHGLQL